MMTITEALAEMKTLDKRIADKAGAVLEHCVRPMLMRDPLEKDGGAEKFVKESMQSMNDLIARKTRIRVEIQKKNQAVAVTVQDQSRTISDWLAWRKESAPIEKRILEQFLQRIREVRGQMAKQQGAAEFQQVTISLSEQGVMERLQKITLILGELDGKLSLANATNTVDI